MDPYDEDNCNDDTLTQRIKELVERTAAATEAETATSPVGIVSPTAEEESPKECDASVILPPPQRALEQL